MAAAVINDGAKRTKSIFIFFDIGIFYFLDSPPGPAAVNVRAVKLMFSMASFPLGRGPLIEMFVMFTIRFSLVRALKKLPSLW